ncbi:MAG: hypothetical protein JWO18_1593 [Microbacteriaceae bacterium]|jgi:uncharacterized OB-fold protein|nr:hypothetical protein [Microbacteriaceae bacterium]
MKSQHTVPEITPLNKDQFDGAREGILRVQTCTDDGGAWYLASSNCPVCLREDTVRWIDASGRGTVWSWIRIHQPYMPTFKDEIPYTVAYIRLEEGPLLMSTLQGIADEDVVCDMPVEVVFVPYGEDATPMPEFRAVA